MSLALAGRNAPRAELLGVVDALNGAGCPSLRLSDPNICG
jgi:hypothetical protein